MLQIEQGWINTKTPHTDFFDCGCEQLCVSLDYLRLYLPFLLPPLTIFLNLPLHLSLPQSPFSLKISKSIRAQARSLPLPPSPCSLPLMFSSSQTHCANPTLNR